MRERRAEVWTRVGVQPLKMGSLYVTEADCRFTYDLDYLETGLPGLGLVYSPAIFGASTIRRPRTQDFDFLPPLQALVPPRGERSFLRQLLLRYLERQGLVLGDRFEQDWELLLHAGHGGIGHLDVFASDEAARDWYSRPSAKALQPIGADVGFSLKEFLTWFDADAEDLLSLIGPTPSVGGAIPKLLVAIPETGWDGRIGLPTRYGDTRNIDVVLKLEQSAAYPGMVELEALGLDLHRAAGLEVPRHWPVELGGLRGLAIERFDRNRQRVPLFMESLHSVLASGSAAVTNHYSADYDRVARALDSPDIQLVDDRKAAQAHLLQRLLLAMLSGNGDLHLQNLSLLMRDGVVAFSPVYDPTPMRAYSLHNALAPGGMGFGGYGGLIAGQDEPVGFAQGLWRFIAATGLGRQKARELMEAALVVTEDYPQRVDALATLPAEHRQRLVEVHRRVRKDLQAAMTAAVS
jgi:serine/threonine-protein kinase HipA